jgi:glycosyltransferase involved in cell wall biosynthesis
LENQVRIENLSDQVVFLGLQANVATYMNAADLLLLTSDTEGIPGVVLEAGLLGLPVVATEVGGVPECIREGETGVLMDPEDECGLANAVVDLLQDHQRWSRLSNSARVWIQREFTISIIAQRYADFYHHVLSLVEE